MTIFDNAVMFLDSLGVTDVILPFILVFTVMFAILMKVGIFKEKIGTAEVVSRRYNAIIALCLALIVVIPHVMGRYPTDSDPIIIINSFLPGAVVLTVALLLFLMLVGFVGGKEDATKSPLLAIAGLFTAVGLIFVLWRALYPNSSPEWLWWLDDPNVQAVVIIILVMGAVVWFVTSNPDEPKTDFKKSLRELFGGS